MTKKLLMLAAVALVLAPAALAGNGNGQTLPGLNPGLFGSGGQQGAVQSTPAQQDPQANQQGQGLRPLQKLRVAVRILERCAQQAQPSDRCTTLAGKVETAVGNLDGKVQDRIAAVQQACTAGSTDPRCQNADRRIARLQKIDARLQAIASKLQSAFPDAAGA